MSPSIRSPRGFTLIELIITIGIIAILMGVAFISLNPAMRIQSARNAQESVSANSIQQALRIYLVENTLTLPLASGETKDICKTGLSVAQASAYDCVRLDFLTQNGNLVTIPSTTEYASEPRRTGFSITNNNFQFTVGVSPDPPVIYAFTAPDSNDPTFLYTIHTNGTATASTIISNAMMTYDGTGKIRTYADANVDATITQIGNGQWELFLSNKTANKTISTVYFPWQSNQIFLNETSSTVDDIVYTTDKFGIATQANSDPTQWAWKGLSYPGNYFAPMIITADATLARIVAATNWPPVTVSPRWSYGRTVLIYLNTGITPLSTRSYRAIITTVQGNAEYAPWMRAMDLYKDWFKANLASEGIVASYPSWLMQSHGWLQVGLMNSATMSGLYSYLKTGWDTWKADMPWVQMWGQMSPYPTGLDPVHEGCCNGIKTLHSRYTAAYPPDANFPSGLAQGLLTLVDMFKNDPAANGKTRIGYYSRPPTNADPDPSTGVAYKLMDTQTYANLGNQTPMQFFTDWTLNYNRDLYGANAFYLDVLGCVSYGDMIDVAHGLIQNEITLDMVVECVSDVLPYAGLISGAIVGANPPIGGPGKTPVTSAKSTFLNLGRYFFDDRPIFLGFANGDHTFWGTAKYYNSGYCSTNPTDLACVYCNQGTGHNCDYWVERQAFLLGAKFDAAPTANEAVALAIAERKAVDWWTKNPRYEDMRGITNVPNEVYIRRFVYGSGDEYLVIDNYNAQLLNISITIDGQVRVIDMNNGVGQPKKLAIVAYP